MASYPRFDRRRLEFRSVLERQSKFRIDDIAVDPDGDPGDPGPQAEAIDRIAARIRAARAAGAPVVICHGAHLIKNGLGPLLVRMVEDGWLQLVATNGAGSIHDLEFGTVGVSCEDVRAYVAEGQFGIWDETGRWTGLSLLVGTLDGLGYGESVGRTIAEGRIIVPRRGELEAVISRRSASSEMRGAAADLLDLLDEGIIEPGEITVPNNFASRSIQAACFRARVPFTVHPGIGQDIIYTHPLMIGGAVGRASLRDFLTYAEVIGSLRGGVYISAGSSVMSPMIFEKSVSMARNIARQESQRFDDFLIVVNDLAEATWDWSHGEPPPEHPAYYVRFLKSFSRMGGEMAYIGLDNRIFLLNLWQRLRDASPS